jgi:pyruvate dehydrogenase E2 component (dihydrolipoamide acetyltransferase)
MTDVVMPQMGESIVEGTLTKWLKKPGERVERDEPLFEISTDKVDTEIPSPAAGTLSELLVEEGKTVGINTVVARIDEGGGAAAAPAKPAAAPPQAESQSQETIQPTPAKAQQVEDTAPAMAPAPEAPPPPPQEAPAAGAEPQGPISPLVRKMAREHNVDLARVKGSGAGGRITKQDMESFVAQQGAQPAAPDAPAAPAPPRPAAAPAAPPAPAPASAAAPAAGGAARTRIEPLSTMRQKIAEHMVMSKRTSAHVTTVHRVDMTKVAKQRERHKATFQSNYGFSLTYLPFIARASVAALRQFPLLNSSLDGNNIIYHNDINIGIAVALENGLIVPVIRNADEKNVLGLQRSIVDLAARARSRQLKPDEVVGGTFSITNFGSFGSLIGTPVINQPQVAILGVGTVDKTAVVIDDAIAIRSICHLSLSFDHRLIDGALADQFMTKVKEVLQNWSEEAL